MNGIELMDSMIKLAMAILLGGLIGAEREFRDKAAGFRTIILICVGSTLFAIFSIEITRDFGGDPTRVASTIVSGVGFLGAGAILQDRGRIQGLTTASTVWLAAALGMGIGSGYIAYVTLVTVAVMVVLWFFPKLEILIDTIQVRHTYEITCATDYAKFEELENSFAQTGLRVFNHKQIKRENVIVYIWDVVGSKKAHQRMMKVLFEDPHVKEYLF